MKPPILSPFKIKVTAPKASNNIAQRLLALKIEIDKSKELYKEYDRLLQVALSRGNLPSRVTYQGVTWGIQILDCFKNSNTTWKSVAQRRFDLAISRQDRK
jgi:hypothetical protein